jgi:hypothetical protein
VTVYRYGCDHVYLGCCMACSELQEGTADLMLTSRGGKHAWNAQRVRIKARNVCKPGACCEGLIVLSRSSRSIISLSVHILEMICLHHLLTPLVSLDTPAIISQLFMSMLEMRQLHIVSQ